MSFAPSLPHSNGLERDFQISLRLISFDPVSQSLILSTRMQGWTRCELYSRSRLFLSCFSHEFFPNLVNLNVKKCKCNLFTHETLRSSEARVNVFVRSRSNWNLEMLVFEERGKPEYPEKNLSEQGREPTTNSTHILHRDPESNPGHIDGRRALSPLRHPCSPFFQ